MTDYSALKRGGFIPQRQDGFFSLRIKVLGGRLEAENLTTLAALAETYGRGHVHLTTRQGLEIPFIRLGDIEAVKEALDEGGLRPASLAPGLRTMTACQGTSVCSSGLMAPQDMVETLDRELDGCELPHKFKIGVTGCPNNCIKAEENDIGLKGALIPLWTAPDRCTHCGLCQKACPVQAIVVTKDDLSYDSEKCIHCGRCYNRCPEKCWSGRPGWHLYFGGLFGNNIQLGRRFFPTLTEDRDVLAAIGRGLEFFRQNGKKRERFGLTVDRVGWDKLEDFLAG